MGKGYNNFMSKKAFHPGSYANQKRLHDAEAKAEAKKKHDEETLAQYMKEQELFHQRSLVSNESREKLSVNFMYDAPPGVEKKQNKNDHIEWRDAGGISTISKSHPALTGCERLEWKRENLVKNSAQERKQRIEYEAKIKARLSEPDVKPGIKVETDKPSTSGSRPKESDHTSQSRERREDRHSDKRKDYHRDERGRSHRDDDSKRIKKGR